MTNLEKLEKYLQDNEIEYEKIDDSWRHQIRVPYTDDYRHDAGYIAWDAVCQEGSYGYEKGLLEIMGELVTEEELQYDTVVGWLTAEEVIKRIENTEF